MCRVCFDKLSEFCEHILVTFVVNGRMTETLRNCKLNQSEVDAVKIGLCTENGSWANCIKIFCLFFFKINVNITSLYIFL